MQKTVDPSNLQLASMRSRAFAFVIDDIIITLLITFIFWDNIMAVSHDSEAMILLMQTTFVMPLIVLKVFYHTFFIWLYGQTLGKKIAKIRIIDANNWGRVNFLSSFLRAVGRIFSEMFFYIGFAIGFFNEGRKTFHDFTGKTLVVNA
ncbi:RDD family protein [Aliarcobacter thereius]|uniref:RDD family protein n=1 Tax=Aliarcobacter thereius LMG 24486 TaxID=1032240 RepID=A0A1C7WT38_9BACT|nr:RDD family protein [Aliarcobacter thereius]OCL91150.1 RDD family protein [Aliarcobacter thereius]OCL95997.1 RDD family protein [Aliarcobacter thereius LMG 24486]QBF16031.1 putative membrane protein, RDD family [Aliarcobacter thereius LMG 24486]TLS94626.1 RDD family protein [Aliarcobacter thereius]HJE03976.1 RDD family protein [Aliarcobacter thereius]